MPNKYSELTNKTRKQMVEDLKEFSEYMDSIGFESYIAWGTLLGAVREGGLILHDNDLDMAYLSKETKPKEVVKEARQLLEQLNKDGWLGAYFDINNQKIKDKGVLSDTAGQMHIMTKRGFCTDLFTTWFDSWNNYWTHQWGIAGTRDTILPLKDVKSEGVMVKGVNNTEEYLTNFYGDWRTPRDEKIKGLTDIRQMWLKFLIEEETILKINIDHFKELQNQAKKEGLSFTHLDKMVHFGYFVDGEIVGFIGYVDEGDTACFKNSYTLKDFRGRGISTKLNNHSINYCKENGFKKYYGFCTKDSLNLQLKAGATKGESDGKYTKIMGKL